MLKIINYYFSAIRNGLQTCTVIILLSYYATNISGTSIGNNKTSATRR